MQGDRTGCGRKIARDNADADGRWSASGPVAEDVGRRAGAAMRDGRRRGEDGRRRRECEYADGCDDDGDDDDDESVADGAREGTDENAGDAYSARPVRAGYSFEEEIARGVYGVVWRARLRDGFGPDVAIKEAGLDGRMGVPQLRETDVLARLCHPCIVRCSGFFFARSVSDAFGRCRSSVFHILELADGTVARYVAQDPPEESRVRVLYELCCAVRFMHAHGVYHCDLKPDNLLIAGGRLRVTDFGLAQYATMPFDTCQTPMYASPEALLHLHSGLDRDFRRRLKRAFGRQPPVRSAIEMWALGCCFAFVLAGSALFPWTDAGASAFAGSLEAYVAAPRRYLLAAGVPARWELLVRRMLDPSVAARIKTVDEVLADPLFAERGYAGAPIDGREIGPVASSRVPALAPDPDVPASPCPSRFGRSAVRAVVERVARFCCAHAMRCETAFLAIDLVHRASAAIAGDPARAAPCLLGAACVLVASKLVDPAPVQPAALSSAWGVGCDRLLAAERELCVALRGVLYPPAFYARAFSRASLAATLSLLADSTAYSAIDPSAFMTDLEGRETPLDRQRRASKDIPFRDLISLHVASATPGSPCVRPSFA